tara:strand:+ start:709 stop:1071 length:363 start_codon:yes stop_codon:yes gene_type:complete
MARIDPNTIIKANITVITFPIFLYLILLFINSHTHIKLKNIRILDQNNNNILKGISFIKDLNRDKTPNRNRNNKKILKIGVTKFSVLLVKMGRSPQTVATKVIIPKNIFQFVMPQKFNDR